MLQMKECIGCGIKFSKLLCVGVLLQYVTDKPPPLPQHAKNCDGNSNFFKINPLWIQTEMSSQYKEMTSYQVVHYFTKLLNPAPLGFNSGQISKQSNIYYQIK